MNTPEISYPYEDAETSTPAPVTGISVEPGADQKVATLHWNDSNATLCSYEIVLANGKKFTAKTNSITLKKLAAGTQSVTIYAVDKEKNRSAAAVYSFSVRDITPPKKGKVAVSQLSSSTVKLTMNGFSDNVGISRYRIYLGGELIGTTENPFFEYTRANLAGKLKFSVSAVDANGNESPRVNVGLTVRDVVAPDAVSGIAVAGTADQSAARLTWNAASDNVGTTAYEVVLANGKKFTTKTNSITLKKLAAGPQTVTIRALDKAKNRSAAVTYSFTVRDTTSPKRGKVAAAQNASGGITLTMNGFSDNVGVTGYRVYLNDALIGTSDRPSYVFDRSGVSGKLNFSVSAVDAAGNESPKAKIKVNLAAPIVAPDTTPPSRVVGVSATVTGNEALLTWQAASDNVGVTSYRITVNGAQYTANATSLRLRNLTRQSYSAVVVAVDRAGNAGPASEAVEFVCSVASAASNSVRLHTDGVVVSSAASMSGKTVASNQFLIAESGGTVNGTVVNGGTLLVADGAAATNTIINSGQGSAANASLATVTMNKGYLTVLDGGVADNVTLSGGALIVRNSGSALNNRIFSGSVDVSSGGVVRSTYVDSAVYIRVGARGSALETVLASGAHGVVYSGGLVSGGTVSKGAGLTVSSGGSAKNMQVSSGGSIYVSNGAKISGLQLVGDYVKFQIGIDSATDVHFISSGAAHSVVGGELSDVTVHLNTYLEVSAGGLVKNINLGALNTSWGGAAEIFSGGRAENLTNHNYGQINVFSGGVLSGAATDTEAEIYLYGGSAENLRIDSAGYVWIHSGGEANDIKITKGGELTVSSGGSANGVVISMGHALVEEDNGFMSDIDIDSGGILEVCGGNADGITVRSGGILTFSSGFNIMDGPWKESLHGRAENVVLSGGILSVRYTGSAYNVTALTDAEVQVSSGSLADGLTLSSGAYTVVNSDGVLTDADILSGAQLDLRGGASASDLRIESGASVNLQYAPEMELAGSVEGTTFAAQNSELSGYIQTRGVLNLASGTIGRDLQILSDGRLNISGGASADEVVVADGGLCYINGRAANVETSGEVHVNGVVADLAVDGNYTHIHAGGVASGVTLDSGGLLVYSGGRVDDLVMLGNGAAGVFAGAEICGLRAAGDSYKLTLNSGSLLRGNISLEQTRIMVRSGARIDFDLTGLDGSSGTPLLSGFDYVSGESADYTISVTADQTPGAYYLAACLDTARVFGGNAWLWVDGCDSGLFLNLTDASVIHTQTRSYSLSQAADGTLLLEIAALESSADAPSEDLCSWPQFPDTELADLAVAGDDWVTSLTGIAESPRTAMLAVR